MVNLDTHILLHLAHGSLNTHEKRILSGATLGISSIVLWEIAKLSQLGRIKLDLSDRRMVDLLATCVIWNLDATIAAVSTQLDFRSDPADEIIAATSVVKKVPLLTRDTRIRMSTVVPFA
jgi:PIN domain nuclease of toxin-antitoxin system